MRLRGLIILVIALLGLSFMVALAHAEEKLAYVNLEQIFAKYNKTKKYDKLLEKEQKEYEKERERKIAEVKKLQEKLSLLSEEERESRRSELEEKISQLQEFDRSSNQDLRKQRDEKLKELAKDINKAIEDYAKEQDITFVFDKRSLIYGEKALNITNHISRIINKR